MRPDEFYQLDHYDYPIVQRSFVKRDEMFQAIARRQTFLICDVLARVNGTKSGINQNSFNQAWPLGAEMIKDISEVIRHKRDAAKRAAIQLTNNVKLIEAIKKIKGARGSKNTDRRRNRPT